MSCQHKCFHLQKLSNTYSIPAFKGYLKHSIVYDPKIDRWIIVDKQLHSGNPYEINYSDYSILAEYAPQVSHSKLPTGLHTWMIFDEDCNDTRKLKLSSVST